MHSHVSCTNISLVQKLLSIWCFLSITINTCKNIRSIYFWETIEQYLLKKKNAFKNQRNMDIRMHIYICFLFVPLSTITWSVVLLLSLTQSMKSKHFRNSKNNEKFQKNTQKKICKGKTKIIYFHETMGHAMQYVYTYVYICYLPVSNLSQPSVSSSSSCIQKHKQWKQKHLHTSKPQATPTISNKIQKKNAAEYDGTINELRGQFLSEKQ